MKHSLTIALKSQSVATYAGGWWDWLTPFTLLCGAAVVAGYALLRACWATLFWMPGCCSFHAESRLAFRWS